MERHPMLIATKKCQDKNKQTNKQTELRMIGLGANNGVSKELALKIKTAPNVL